MVFQDKIAIIGLGYVGLPTAMYFAEKGIVTTGIEISQKKVELISEGISPIADDFIEKTLPKVLNSTFKITSDFQEIKNVKVILIILPTPVDESKKPNLKFIESAAVEIAKNLQDGQLVILESTVYPGVTEEVLVPILETSGLKVDRDFGVAYCPERFNPGDKNHTIDKTVRVIGASSKKWNDIANELYSCIQKTHPTTNIRTAEMCKVIENTQRDLNIALMNELALICERLNLDIMEVLEAAFTKWNFGRYYPGPGVGGHCLPHDPYYLVEKAIETGYKPRIIIAGRELNDNMPYHMLDLLIRGLNKKSRPMNGSRILVLGATYKSNIDDLRTSPAEILVDEMKRLSARITIVEPNVNVTEVFGCPNVQNISDVDLNDFDALVVMVDHREFKQMLEEYLLNTNIEHLIIVDGKRFLTQAIESKAFQFIQLGRGN